MILSIEGNFTLSPSVINLSDNTLVHLKSLKTVVDYYWDKKTNPEC